MKQMIEMTLPELLKRRKLVQASKDKGPKRRNMLHALDAWISRRTREKKEQRK